jgi:Vanillate O-demethylase oxygenase C-terminal domain
VPHTAFLHGGLFRNDGERKPIQCVVTREADRVECEYIGEERPSGLVGRLLSPSGGVVVHFDRFYLPSVVEVEYQLGTENHVLVDAALTPVDDYHTRLNAVVAVRTRIPGWLVRPLVTPFALRIFAQDAKILRRQTATLQAFGEAKFVSTEIDGLGPHILKLLLRAASGTSTEPRRPWRKEFTLMV